MEENKKEALDWILQRNDLKGQLNCISYQHCPKGVFVTFEADPMLDSELLHHKKLNAGIHPLVLKRIWPTMNAEDSKTAEEIVGHWSHLPTNAK